MRFAVPFPPAQFRHVVILVGLLVLLSACATTFPQALTAQVDPTVGFPQLMQNPDVYRGRIVMFGGELIRAVLGDGETELEILQRPLRADDLPSLSQASQGRFLVRVPAALRRTLPEVGGLITVIGEVLGAKDRGEEPLPYLEARDLKVWPSSAALPDRPYRVDPGPYWGLYWAYPYWFDPWLDWYRWYWRPSWWFWGPGLVDPPPQGNPPPQVSAPPQEGSPSLMGSPPHGTSLPRRSAPPRISVPPRVNPSPRLRPGLAMHGSSHSAPR